MFRKTCHKEDHECSLFVLLFTCPKPKHSKGKGLIWHKLDCWITKNRSRIYWAWVENWLPNWSMPRNICIFLLLERICRAAARSFVEPASRMPKSFPFCCAFEQQFLSHTHVWSIWFELKYYSVVGMYSSTAWKGHLGLSLSGFSSWSVARQGQYGRVGVDPTQLSVQRLRPTETLILSLFLTISIKAVIFWEGGSVVLFPKSQGKDLLTFQGGKKKNKHIQDPSICCPEDIFAAKHNVFFCVISAQYSMGIDWAYSTGGNRPPFDYSAISLPFPRTHCKGPEGELGFPPLLPITGDQNGDGENRAMVLYSGSLLVQLF